MAEQDRHRAGIHGRRGNRGGDTARLRRKLGVSQGARLITDREPIRVQPRNRVEPFDDRVMQLPRPEVLRLLADNVVSSRRGALRTNSFPAQSATTSAS